MSTFTALGPGSLSNGITANPGDFLGRLKAETRNEHIRVEAALVELMSDWLSEQAYRRRLGQFLGLYAPIEEGFRNISGWSERGIDLAARRKTPLIEADLRVLGEDTPESLPHCMALASCADMASAFGCMYVVEGATLGGQIISRHLSATLGITPDRGGRFFHGYGRRTAEMWQSFRNVLLAFAIGEAVQDRIITSAIATFQIIRLWCGEGRE